MKNARIYDFNGVIVSTDGFRRWFEQTHPALFNQHYKREGESIQLICKPSAEVLAIYEQATTNCLYLIELLPNVKEKLELDYREGYARILFTGVPRQRLTSKIREFGLEQLLEEIVTVEDLKDHSSSTLAKEDPKIFEYLISYLQGKGFTPTAYVDDSIRRIEAAVKANQTLQLSGNGGIDQLYLFDQKNPSQEGNDYKRINNLLLMV